MSRRVSGSGVAAPPDGAAAEALYREAVRHLDAGSLADGIAALEKASQAAPGVAAIAATLSAAYAQAGEHALAESGYERALALDPRNAPLLTAYGVFLLRQGRLDAARPLLARAEVLAPARPEVLNASGQLHYAAGDLQAAEERLMRGLAANPSMPDAHATLGHILRDTGRGQLAEKAYSHALQLDPRNAAAVDLANLLFDSFGREVEAVELLRGYLERNPGNGRARVRLLEMLEEANRVDEARVQLQEARRILPRVTRIAVVEAKLLRREGKTKEAATLLERQASEPRETDSDKASRHFELGRLYDALGDADSAFDAFSVAKRLRAQQGDAPNMDRSTSRRLVSRIRASLPAGAERGSAAPPPAKSPLFLVGFPRSGTTLLDQILSSHPGVTVSEERPAISILLGKAVERRSPAGLMSDEADYAACLRALTAPDIESMRQFYFDAHGHDPKQPGIFVDKMPLNLLHADFIRLLFPEAKFVVALRHPCDAVLSFFMQDFSHSQFMVRSLDLQDAARFYDEAFGLWEDARATLRLDATTVRYESIVADFRSEVESLLSFMGLPWHDAVLEFDKMAKGRNRIRTPSYHQVTQKIYTRASGRWQRYRKHLEPILPVLAPHAERYGYSMDAAQND